MSQKKGTTTADLLHKKELKKAKTSQDLKNQENAEADHSLYTEYFPLFWKITDMDRWSNFAVLAVIRLLMAVYCTKTQIHPDEYWQATQPAYLRVYGSQSKHDLPWEWADEYQLRNTLYPAYLTSFFYLAKHLQIDSNAVVMAIPYVAHWPIVLLQDAFIWRVSKRLIGKDASKFAFALMFINRFQASHVIRCFTNIIEQVFGVVAFHFWLDQKERFTRNTVILTALITISFMMRNTSPVGWIPLLGYKVLFQGSLKPFILSAITVALPLIFALIYLDTWWFGAKDELVLTSWNFLKMNILEGLSKFFGTSPIRYYAVEGIPVIFGIMFPLAWYSIYFHAKRQWQGYGKHPFLIYYIVFYFMFFSLIPHKEMRFLLPMLPFCFICLGDLISYMFKKYPFWIAVFFKMHLFGESFGFFITMDVQEIVWQNRLEIAEMNPPVHSVWLNDRFNTPHFSSFHRPHDKPEDRIQVYHNPKNPQFCRERFGHPLPIANEFDIISIGEMINEVQVEKKIRPEIIIISHVFCQHRISSGICDDLSMHAITHMTGEKGTPLYEHVKDYPHMCLEWEYHAEEDGHSVWLGGKNYHLFRLRDEYKPF